MHWTCGERRPSRNVSLPRTSFRLPPIVVRLINKPSPGFFLCLYFFMLLLYFQLPFLLLSLSDVVAEEVSECIHFSFSLFLFLFWILPPLGDRCFLLPVNIDVPPPHFVPLRIIVSPALLVSRLGCCSLLVLTLSLLQIIDPFIHFVYLFLENELELINFSVSGVFVSAWRMASPSWFFNFWIGWATGFDA